MQKDSHINLGGKRIARTSLAVKKITPQFDLEQLEHRLMLAIIANALSDINSNRSDHRTSAIRYLQNDLCHAEICGVEPEWIRMIINKVGINLTL